MDTEDNDRKYLELALEQARKALEIDEVPVGCVVVRNKTGEIVTRAHNQTNAHSDPLSHAEYLCVREILDKNRMTDRALDEILHNTPPNNQEYTPPNNQEYTFYITLEPCAMCIGILERFKTRIVFGYHNDIFGAEKILKKECGRCLNDERCIEILKEFYSTPNKNTTQSL